MLLWLIELAFLLAGGAIPMPAAENVAPVHKVDGSFVRDWLVLGPFPSRDFESDFLIGAGGEANIRPIDGDTVVRSDGTQLAWTRLHSDYDLVNLEKVFGIRSWSVAYAYCEISSDRAIETDFRLPVYPSLLWINGQKVEPNSIRPDGFSGVSVAGPIQLKAGVNSCLLKLRIEAIDSQEWLFSLQPLPPERASVELLITDGKGRPVPDALVQWFDQGELVWRLRTEPSGLAQACLFPLAKAYDLRVISGEAGAWLYDLALRPGERRKLYLSLTPAVSLSGRTLALDGSPQNAIVVQALREPDPGRADLPVRPDVGLNEGSDVRAQTRMEALKSAGSAAPNSGPRGSEALPYDGRIQSILPKPPFSETVLSDTNGNFRFVNLRPGAYRLRCHGPDGFIYPTNNLGKMDAPPVIVAPGRTNEPVGFMFANAKKGVWRNYRIAKGLVQLNPVAIHRTPDGLLWVGTSSGTVHSYDGVEFKMFQAPQIPGNFVQSINHDSAGTVWIGTSGGISRTVNGQFEPLALGDLVPRKSIPSIQADPDGTVWFATLSGLGQYEAGRFSIRTVREGLPMNVVGPLIRSREGGIWMGTGMGIVTLEDGRVSLPLGNSGPRPMTVRSLHQSRDGAIWFGGTLFGREGVFRFDGHTLRHLGTEDGMPSDEVDAVAETSNGDLWFGTKNGLSRFNGTTIVNYTEQDGQSNLWVRDIFVDQDDVLWLANGWGVSRFDPNTFSGFSNRDGIYTGSAGPVGVFSFEPDPEGGFWVGTEWGGVYRINQQKNRPTVTPACLQYYYVRQIHRDNQGTLWFGTSNGIYKRVDGALNRVLNRNWVIALTSDDRGRPWFGLGWNGGGVSRLDPSTGVESVFTKKNGLPSDDVWSLERRPEGGVWIGTGAGLALAHGETIEDESGRLGLPRAPIYGLRHDASGTLWISTAQGLYYWNGTNTVSITATNGLPDEHVWCSARTTDGIIWIGTDSNGLVGYDGKAMTVLDKRDGLEGNKVFAVTPDGDRSLWAGFLDGGLTRYRRTKSRPSVRLLEVSLGDRTLTNATSLARAETGHRVRIRYQEIDLKTHPEKRQFCYRLVNHSGQTVFAGVTKDRSFDWVPEQSGSHTFEVQAIDRDLNYSEPARLIMQVFVPWHANAWVLAPAIVAFCGLLAWAFVARALYVRKSREAAVLRERDRISRDLHDHLGAGLTHLAMVGDLVRQQAAQPGAVEMLAHRLTESARDLTRTMGEIIWTTDPDKDTLRSFALFINSYTDRFFAGSALRLRFDFPPDIPDLPLPTEFRSSLLTVTKEALNNVAKHAKASELRVKLELREQELRLSFEDNGQGFLMRPAGSEGRGLVNMQQRLRDLGGELRIESTVGQGTRVHARLPLPKK